MTHIDDGAIEAVGALYDELGLTGDVLDLEGLTEVAQVLVLDSRQGARQLGKRLLVLLLLGEQASKMEARLRE